MNEVQLGELAASQQMQAGLFILGAQLFQAVLIGAGIIAVAIILHAVIHGLIVRRKAERS